MRRLILMMGVLVALSSSTWAAFYSELKVLNKTEMAALSDENLVDAYMDALVEIEAQKTFHVNAGFTVKELGQYREVLKYRLGLLMEIHKRHLEIPQFDRYSN